MHTGNHLQSYYNEVENRFKASDKFIESNKLTDDDARKYIVKILQEIRSDIMNGKLLTNNTK